MLLIIIALAAAGIDQLTKHYIKSNIEFGESISVWKEFIKITHTHNIGAAFNFLANTPAKFREPFFIGISFLAIAIILWFTRRITKSGIIYEVSFGLILGGALGNLIDRIRWGYIIDFVDIGLKTYRWPVFNVSDSCISIGVILIIFATLFKKK